MKNYLPHMWMQQSFKDINRVTATRQIKPKQEVYNQFN
jgi:hypothetical protein